jgi:hypothetical protein
MISDQSGGPAGEGDTSRGDTKRKYSGLLGFLGCLGIIVGGTVAVIVVLGVWLFAFFALSDGYVILARSLSAGDPRGMAAAAWLLFFAGSVGVLALVLIRGRVASRWIYAIGAMVVLLATAACALLPVRDSFLAETVDGPGGSGFITGARWGMWTAVMLLLIAAHVWMKELAKDFYVRGSMLRWRIGGAVVLAVGALAAAVIRAS